MPVLHQVVGVVGPLNQIIEWRGKPQHSVYINRNINIARHEWIDLDIVEAIEEVQEVATVRPWT